MAEKKDNIRSRIYLVYSIMLIAGLMIFSKAAYIQFVEADELLTEQDSSSIRYKNITASRGSIYAEDGKLLVTSVPIFDIRMDTKANIDDELFYSKVDSLAQALHNLFPQISYEDFLTKLRKARQRSDQYLLLKRNVTYSQLQEIKTFPILRRGKFKGGLIVESKEKREKPFRQLAFRTLGWDKEGEDLDVGLEGSYSDFLSGHDGVRVEQRMPNGSWKGISDKNMLEPVNGHDVHTTLDIFIQDVAENALLEQLEKSKADHGCVIVMEVETGKIKAIANLKRDTATKTYTEEYNFAIGERYEPGSTFKLASMMAALEDQKIKLTDSVNVGQGYCTFYNAEMKDATHMARGLVSYQKAFEASSNVGISKMIFSSYSKNPMGYISQLRKMGLANKLGLEIRGEPNPYIKDPNDQSWSRISLPWMAIGYELQVTPLQLLSFYNAVANNGKLMRPYFVNEIIQTGEVVQTFEPVVLNEAIASQATIAQARFLLERVVSHGTATNINSEIYKIAGKTGTAQIAAGTGGYDKKNYAASFAGYFPADKPKYSCIVVINKPVGDYYGGHIAAPVFKIISDKIYAMYLDGHHQSSFNFEPFKHPNVAAGPRDERIDLLIKFGMRYNEDSIKSPYAAFISGTDEIKTSSRSIEEGKMPNLVGMDIMEAMYIMEKQGIKVKISGYGRVSKQSIPVGTAIKKGRTVWLDLSI